MSTRLDVKVFMVPKENKIEKRVFVLFMTKLKKVSLLMERVGVNQLVNV